MLETTEWLIQMARAAMQDERLSDGALYGKLADRLEQQLEVIAEWANAEGISFDATTRLSHALRLKE